MQLKNIATIVALTGFIAIGSASVNGFNSQSNQAVAKEINIMTVKTSQNNASVKEAKKDATGLTVSQKIEMLTKHKGMFGSGDELRRYFFGDLDPISVQPGGAGMVVNLYNKANNTTFAYCSTYDVVVAVKSGKVKMFEASEVK
ncbi:hypothetical protein [Calothrix sp. PCC 6303]|uniref:hypothetical protein n=1 Tax=Calothrix sp. PCC 6303 TaxID=1170562 RepID=UPI0002A021F3|nr:hypothetical protein [Calothrix sp. PCC 6303]AFZ00042.1 hypothetical protein Cal6303_0977 [Calothrix sp. PCC 6303]